MKFTVSKSSFLKELSAMQGIVERKNTIPVLSQLLIETVQPEQGPSGIILKGTDLDISLTTMAQADVVEPGAICLPAKKLYEIVNALPESEISFEIIEDQAHIKCLKSRFKLLGLKSDNFPEIHAPDVAEMATIPAKTMALFITRTQFAITNEESRYALNGAKIELSKKGFRMVATDGHRMAFIHSNEVQADVNVDKLIPRKALSEVLKQAKDAGDGNVLFSVDDNKAYFKIGTRVISSRLLSGQFPNYEMVLPKDNNLLIEVGGLALVGALKRASLMADARSQSVKMTLHDHSLQFEAQTQDNGDAMEQLAVNYDGPLIVTGFNAGYMQDFLAASPGLDVVLALKDSQTQIQMTIKGGAVDYRYVVMPMRL